MQEKSIFIRVLRYGAEKGLSGFTLDQYRDWLLSLPEVQDKDSIEYNRGHTLLEECFYYGGYADKEQKLHHYVLKNEYYFRLVEYQELEESRKAARSANRNSTIAISISVLAIVSSVFLSYRQTTAPITISEGQVKYLQELLTTNTEAQIKQIEKQTSEITQALSSTREKIDKEVSDP
ncbi:MAG: hypothetical protein JAY90_12205 [Candidatus Thiodiazotropha lotti]|nr:hypothetical protein [Candidatus Thiodiazotropha lotti]